VENTSVLGKGISRGHMTALGNNRAIGRCSRAGCLGEQHRPSDKYRFAVEKNQGAKTEPGLLHAVDAQTSILQPIAVFAFDDQQAAHTI